MYTENKGNANFYKILYNITLINKNVTASEQVTTAHDDHVEIDIQ